MCEVSLMIEVGHRSGEVRMGQGEAGRTSSPKLLPDSMPQFSGIIELACESSNIKFASTNKKHLEKRQLSG